MAFADSRLDISGLGQLAAAIGAIPASEGKRSILLPADSGPTASY